MPALRKLLSKFDKAERKIIEALIEKVISLNWRGLDVKKLKGYQNIFRVRKGKIRIIFSRNGKNISILSVERRREDTYRL
ncbi:MAG: Addiction module toxin, RelE/StbE family [Candidatus Jorgensenbacteria bacterium GW2011_GWA1_48_13]|uniref:Addiction module toxin, RelE/StbE family n=1 Tax=Candidatus Jorgensenbacteria bacterium GW2011_GWB1_50_10 TaxID=1618665 RepID=A0A0G1W892_9BACT|nr:MAG: Addiction module toxin, RelE/StbE family [Candidatus Jorgensenbacteria bacterium GW2011_GWA1_48_13]KKW14991.1 MAG: Addiction module toxin, RelE/StbE family [Candidatus Jorgensenbacteria bacterium GW2011_GWB1_50_10]